MPEPAFTPGLNRALWVYQNRKALVRAARAAGSLARDYAWTRVF